MQTQITQPPTTSMPAPAGGPTTRRLPSPVRSSLLVACITAVAVAVASQHHLERVPLVAGEMACALAAARTVRRGLHRRGWRQDPPARGAVFVAMGVLACLAGNAFVVPSRIATTSFPPRAQAVALIGYPLLVCGMTMLSAGRGWRWDLDTLQEATLIPALLAFVTWVVILQQNWSLPAGALTFGLGRPALDLVLVLVAIRHLRSDDSRFSATAWHAYAVGALALLAADICGTVGPMGGPPVPGQLVAPLLLIAWASLAAGGIFAASEPELNTSGPGQFNAIRLTVVMAAVLSGPVLLVADLGNGTHLHEREIAVGAAIVSGLAVAYLVRRVEEGTRLGHLALHDDLTGLPNRVLFAHRVSSALVHAERSGEGSVVMFLDLDRFKTINDSLGHAAGNELLRLVGRRLRSAVRDEDTVARLGGDEFTILMPGVADRESIGPPTDRVLAAFADPFRIAERDLFVSPSIGIAVAPRDGTSVDTLLKNADAAMYRAKASGRNTYRFYTPDMNAQAHKRLTMESSLHRAIERRELVLHYQPKVDLRTGLLVGMEALARWTHPEHGLVPPDEFIPLAEETGLIVPLGLWALETACAQTRSWRETGRNLTVAVNLSARQFEHQQMADVVAGVLRLTGLTPEALELELTESVALADPVAITSTLRDIKSLGVSCSIDDFGTGYSGLSYLSRLPIDTLKIDKSFIHQIARGDDEARIVAAIIALAHGLRMRVIAEGVETVEQLSFLQANGCDEMQGYLVSEPLCVEAFGTLLQRPASTRLDRGPVLTLPDRLFRPAIAVPRASLERTLAFADSLASSSPRKG